jgi:hypothetical protein
VITTALVLPSPRALLAPVSEVDPVADLRAICRTALDGLPDGRVVVVAPPLSDANAARGIAEPLGHRIAAHLLEGVSFDALVASPEVARSLREAAEPTTLVVMADGSARRDEKAPGHLHVDARAFDDTVEAALLTGDADTLARLDPALGPELWCEGIPGLLVLGEVARGCAVTAEVSYADAPYGVAWWVARWELEPGA